MAINNVLIAAFSKNIQLDMERQLMAPQSSTSRVWSTQQDAIYSWFEGTLFPGRHCVVRALAGTGKSTTIREGVKRLCAGQVRVQTLHSVGLGCVRRFRDNIKVEFTSTRADSLVDKICGNRPPDAVKRLVSKLHTKGREIAPHATKLGDLTSIAITFECEPDEQWAKAGFGLDYVETAALQCMELASQVKSGDTIDGSDMIFLPVRNGWLTKQFDRVLVDEAQDMTVAQLEIAQGVLNDGGLMCVVGDNHQAIFGFRGADSESLDRLKTELNAVELGLTTTYRCGKAIVELAQAYVPNFEAGPNNCEGEILEMADIEGLTAAAQPGDFILSRVNAPIVSIAMKLLRAGKRCHVAGRDIGKGLTTLIRKMRARSVPELLSKIEAWATRENARHQAQLAQATNGRRDAIKAKMEAVTDQAEMMIALTEGAKSVTEVETRVEALFTDDGLGAAGLVTLSSVHRAKGLEADRVFILRDTLRDYNQEEKNIAYVAITRAKKTLVWVGNKREQ